MNGSREEITKTLVRFGKRPPESGGPSVPWLREKAQIGQYRIVRRLGFGGMGQVYLALDTKLGRHVALKVLSPDLTADPANVARFKQEAYAASALNHPNILTIYDFCEIDGAHIIVSEFIDGITLRTAIERNVLDLEQALDVAAQVASALAAAHAAGVVHRDLKPTNIMLRPDGYAKVIDFGLAKLAERTRQTAGELTLTRPGTVVGTIRYMSPEQARGDEVDHRGDLWSLGVVLYELLAGQPPFEGTTDNHLIVAIMDAPPKPLPTNIELPKGLDAMVERALMKKRRDRYQSAREFLADLQVVQTSRPAGGSSLSLHRRPRAWKMPWLYSGALALVLAALFTWLGPLGGRWKLQRPDWFQVDHLERITYDGSVHRAAISPDGKWLAYSSGPAGGELLHVRSLPNGEDRMLPATDNSYWGMTFSPDSKLLFFVLRDQVKEKGTLFSIGMDEFGRLPQRMIIDDVDGPVAFSPDGGSFAFLRNAEVGSSIVSSIYTVPLTDVHRERSITSLRDALVYPELSWSKQGIAVVVFPSSIAGTSRASIYIYTPQGKFLSEVDSANFRAMQTPVFVPGQPALFISADTRGGTVLRLEELSLPTHEWHTVVSDIADFGYASVTQQGDRLAVVRSNVRSSIWMAEAARLNAPARISAETENFKPFAWLGNDRLIAPYERTQNQNLIALNVSGKMDVLGEARNAVETAPATVSGHSEVVYESNAARGGNEFDIWKRTADGKIVSLTSGPNYDLEPQITPDGKWVLYSSFVLGEQTLWRVPLSGGVPQRVGKWRARSAFISPDGHSIVCQIRDVNGSWRVAILSFPKGEAVREIQDLPIDSVVRWSPDGSALDYIAHDESGSSILRLPLKGGAPQTLLKAPQSNIVFFGWNWDGTKLAYLVRRTESDVVLLHRARE